MKISNSLKYFIIMCVRIPKDSIVTKQKSVVLEIHYAVNIASLSIDTQAFTASSYQVSYIIY